MKKLISFLILAVMLASCSTAKAQKNTAADAPLAQASSAAGPEGLSSVEVSDGVTLISGNQADASSEVEAATDVPSATEPPASTVDPASIALPEGIPLYPNLTRIDEYMAGDLNGQGTKYVIFYTADSSDDLTEYYKEKAAAAGYDLMASDAAADETGMRSSMWSNAQQFLILQNWLPQDGEIKVQLSWMPIN